MREVRTGKAEIQGKQKGEIKEKSKYRILITLPLGIS